MKNSMKFKPLPLLAAKNISKTYNQDQVIVLTWNKVSGKIQKSTYGFTDADQKQVDDFACCVTKDVNGWSIELGYFGIT